MKLIRYQYPHAHGANANGSVSAPVVPSTSRFEALFEDFFGDTNETSQVAMDLFEDEQNYYARFELPGLKKSDIDLELENAVLTIRNTQAEEGEVAERKSGFKRSISVPDGVAFSKVTASHKDGVLTVTMPKEEARKPRRIEVK